VSFGAGSAGQNINGNASRQFKKRTHLFIGVHNEMLSVAMGFITKKQRSKLRVRSQDLRGLTLARCL